ncbi:MAG: DUF2845 domain-containing protein [Methylococcaceae bacterium]|nr:DUF2845 domain-containing protein [Methylococcaceae bacterium]
MKQSKFLLMLLSLLFSYPVFALRCGNLLVDLGNYKQIVINKCGDPESIDTHIERRGLNNSAGLSQYYGNGSFPSSGAAINYGQQGYIEIDVVVEEWLYNFGHNRFQQLLRFENGKLVEIRELGYGH